MKKKWNNPTVIPRKIISMNNPVHTREHKNRFEKRRRPQCFECGSYDHFRPQYPKLKKSSSKIINRVKSNSENASLDPYIIRGKVNGIEMPIFRDTGASIDIIYEKFITPNMFTDENVWVQHILDEHMTCLPLAEVEIDYLEHNSLPRREMVNAIQTRSQRKKEAEQNSTSEAGEKVEMKLDENLAEDIENLLSSFTEDKGTL
ncbi:uncharacterized protein TNIN_145351 [Trichonephila inaurata madagascariensis]|uniref:Uncharacterized protein n=1 Tax=Trichonephila inaurata madagascariensis TaxID=2747483 RepID=A0A8X6ICT7_9ARAC|nr:uncharacterized protein TNIN_145351 [Trichonephila inaurata madagascariensis]